MKSFCMCSFVALTMAISMGMLYEIFSLRDDLYMMSASISFLEDKISKIPKPEPSSGIDTKFKQNTARAYQVLSVGQLRIHHFVEPHSDKFYEGCQECNKERKEMLQQQIPPDMKKLQQLKLPSEGNYDTGK